MPKSSTIENDKIIASDVDVFNVYCYKWGRVVTIFLNVGITLKAHTNFVPLFYVRAEYIPVMNVIETYTLQYSGKTFLLQLSNSDGLFSIFNKNTDTDAANEWLIRKAITYISAT